MIALIADKFAQRNPPTTDEELALRTRQRGVVTGIILAVSSASQMAGRSPSRAGAILQAVEKLCTAELPTTEGEFATLRARISATDSEIQRLSQENAMASL